MSTKPETRGLKNSLRWTAQYALAIGCLACVPAILAAEPQGVPPDEQPIVISAEVQTADGTASPNGMADEATELAFTVSCCLPDQVCEQLTLRTCTARSGRPVRTCRYCRIHLVPAEEGRTGFEPSADTTDHAEGLSPAVWTLVLMTLILVPVGSLLQSRRRTARM